MTTGDKPVRRTRKAEQRAETLEQIYDAAEELFAQHGISPRVRMELSSNEAIKQAVMAGMGISLLSLHTIGLELRHRLIATPEVEGMPVMRRWHVVNNLAKTLSPAAEAFRYFILERGESFLAEQFPRELGTETAAVNAPRRRPRAAAPRPAAGPPAAAPLSRRRT